MQIGIQGGRTLWIDFKPFRRMPENFRVCCVTRWKRCALSNKEVVPVVLQEGFWLEFSISELLWPFPKKLAELGGTSVQRRARRIVEGLFPLDLQEKKSHFLLVALTGAGRKTPP